MLISEIQPFKLKESAPEPILFFSYEELVAESRDSEATLAFDIETYPNYFLIVFKSVTSGKVVTFEISPDKDINTAKLRWIAQNFILVGFNSKFYDIPMLWAAINGIWLRDLKQLSDAIIYQELTWGQIERSFGFKIGYTNHIDLYDVAVGRQTPLKLYGGRLHTKKLQDLPYDPNELLTFSESLKLFAYCCNDLDITIEVYNYLKPQIELRQEIGLEYELDLRSKSDAQIAEAVICREVQNLSGRYPHKPKLDLEHPYKYQPPDYLNFKTDQMRSIFKIIKDTKFFLGASNKYDLPFDIHPTIGRTEYTIGIGGLHSCEKSQSVYQTEEYDLCDFDVASYYPNIILNQGLAPEHLQPYFGEVYKSIVERRLKAKAEGDYITNQSLKVVINGSFGKFGSQYSRLFSPTLLLQVTLTGQLTLLYLIESLELEGISVVSANTDGIVVRSPISKRPVLAQIMENWQRETKFDLEMTPYRALYSRDVNNYIAIKPDGQVKLKGAYSEISGSPPSHLGKNPQNQICVDAVVGFLTEKKSIQHTIVSCKDINKFVTVRRVRGGAVKGKVYLGKNIRWYYSKDEFGCIRYSNSGNKVPKTDGAYPIMDIPTSVPKNIDYKWYVREAESILHDIGYYAKDEQTSFAFN